MPKSSATQALLFGRADYPQEGYGRIEIDEHDDEDENQSVGKKLFSKSTNRKIVEPILEDAALDSNNICEIVFGRTGVRFSKANGGTGCAAEMEDALNQKPVQTLKKIEQGQELTLKYSLYDICDYL